MPHSHEDHTWWFFVVRLNEASNVAPDQFQREQWLVADADADVDDDAGDDGGVGAGAAIPRKQPDLFFLWDVVAKETRWRSSWKAERPLCRKSGIRLAWLKIRAAVWFDNYKHQTCKSALTNLSLRGICNYILKHPSKASPLVAGPTPTSLQKVL